MTRVALVSHCLLNQNAKVAEYAICPGAVPWVLEELKAAQYLPQQMPCPEMTFLGAGRWWQVREQYDTPGYRRHCRHVAASVASVLKHSLQQGCEDLVLLGVDGSPSSGIGMTDSGPAWGGRPEAREMALVHGKGVWIGVLEEVLAEEGLPAPRTIGIGTELPDYDEAAARAAFRRFLAWGR